MKFQQDVSLKSLNTFGIDAYAAHYATFSQKEELEQLLATDGLNEYPYILGGGSNILFTKNANWVLKNEITGIDVLREDEEHVYVRTGAGENWHRFVRYCIGHGWAGVENLSLIPGNAGASPMQNIGAYGVEIKDVFHSLEAFHLKDRCLVTFTGPECQFGYRNSIFKNKYKGQFAILEVTYRLNKTPHYHISYGALEKELSDMGVTELTLAAVSDAVIRIRTSKLPDPKKIGNAGSFFKNPEVPPKEYERIKEEYPGIIAYPTGEGYKLAAGWLIEQCGWKGYREGDAGVHARQALVLVNYGHATGRDIFALSEKISAGVREKFGIELEREVNII